MFWLLHQKSTSSGLHRDLSFYVTIIKNILILESNVEVTNYICKTLGDNNNLSRSI